jgi:hypothetical protein
MGPAGASAVSFVTGGEVEVGGAFITVASGTIAGPPSGAINVVVNGSVIAENREPTATDHIQCGVELDGGAGYRESGSFTIPPGGRATPPVVNRFASVTTGAHTVSVICAGSTGTVHIQQSQATVIASG